MKTKTITLTFPHADMRGEIDPRALPLDEQQRYRVVRVTNSVEFSPRQQLTKKEVDELCESKAWNVTLVPA